MAAGDAPPHGTAEVVALIRHAHPERHAYAELVEDARSALPLLEEEHGLLAAELIDAAANELVGWQRSGIRVLTVLDAAYPENLRGVHDRPPLIFVLGELAATDSRAVAVIGSRQASPAGLASAAAIAADLVEAGYTVVSGLAHGIDTAVHRAALAGGGRTLAVIGTGLEHCYPAENAALQRQIADEGAVISRFWPDAPPAKANFPLRNSVMSGLSLATVIVEAGLTSGARIQARLALGHGRPVLLMRDLLEQDWARELAERPSVHVISGPGEVAPLVGRLTSSEIRAI